MGIDPGFKNIGVVVAEYPNKSIIYENTYSAEFPKTHMSFTSYLASLFSEYDLTDIAIERPFFTSQTITSNLGTLEFIGIIKLLCEKYEFNLAQYSPKAIKKYATGSGSADKKAMIKAAKELFSCSFSSNHTADAACIAHTHFIKASCE